MKKIILASASQQRKVLLRNVGLKIQVRPSRCQEEENHRGGCAALVKYNALKKARDVAKVVQSGLVIGADTVVFSRSGHIIGKPRDLGEARRIIDNMAARPHWVYTGVAVVDAATGKTEVDYEKTKVFMQKLSATEIGRYHAVTSPFDKAGGFDIEGRGGLFIRRIEGCYSNVIGLPMAKLRLMLKKFGVSLL